MTFIRNHRSETWACDFFVIVSIGFRLLYGFVVLSLARRRLVHVGVTPQPSAESAAPRSFEASADEEHVPRFLVHDRDSGDVFRARVRGGPGPGC
jgi:hypothetical protein